jgi:hypothetical protein
LRLRTIPSFGAGTNGRPRDVAAKLATVSGKLSEMVTAFMGKIGRSLQQDAAA